MYFVYILQCKDKTLYTGITTDIERRLIEHKNGKGAKYTKSHRAGKVVYTETHPNRSSASKREAAIKKLRRAAKLTLIKEKTP